ncbi:hypothetical protein ACWGNN_00910 [Streptomyces sp. NPDC055817]
MILDPTAKDLALAAEVAELLGAHHPEARLDATGRVVSAGFSSSPGLPGDERVRVGHEVPLPSSLNDRTFTDNEAEEHVLVGAYADLLRSAGWDVKEIPMRSGLSLLASRSEHPRRLEASIPA